MLVCRFAFTDEVDMEAGEADDDNADDERVDHDQDADDHVPPEAHTEL